MPTFSQISAERLGTCDQRLILLFTEVVRTFDCTVICGHRGEDAQNEAFAQGKSKLTFPKSTHNKLPSMGVDVAPYPIVWEDYRRFYFFGGFVMGTAQKMGIPIRWGGDWDSDTEVSDQSFNDLLHFEVPEEIIP